MLGVAASKLGRMRALRQGLRLVHTQQQRQRAGGGSPWLFATVLAQCTLLALQFAPRQALCDRAWGPRSNLHEEPVAVEVPKGFLCRCASSCKSKPRHARPVKVAPAAQSVVPAHTDCGEDAYFVAETATHVYVGVADGVGGWQELGVDPAEFAWALMTKARELALSGPKGQLPNELLAKAYEHVLAEGRVVAGSSTACVAMVDKATGVVHCSNLGDSGLLLLRAGRVVYHTKEQQHFFNAPYQLAVIPPHMRHGAIVDHPRDADNVRFVVEEGDVLLVGTDGLFDNMYDSDIEAELKPKDAEFDVQAAASQLVDRAAQLAADKARLSPFAKSAQAHGYRVIGGKLDDICAVVVHVGQKQQ